MGLEKHPIYVEQDCHYLMGKKGYLLSVEKLKKLEIFMEELCEKQIKHIGQPCFPIQLSPATNYIGKEL